MKKSEFDTFLEEVRRAGYHSWIWWAAYMWMNMTKRQAHIMAELLDYKPEVLKVIRNEQKIYQFSSGIEWTVKE